MMIGSQDGPVASQIADGSKNSDIGRKLNHEEQIAKLRVKFQQVRRKG